MGWVAKTRLAAVVVVVVALSLMLAGYVLPVLGIALPAWHTTAMIYADFALLACFLVLFALRYRPEARKVSREIARREGRTTGFYIRSIVAMLGLGTFS